MEWSAILDSLKAMKTWLEFTPFMMGADEKVA